MMEAPSSLDIKLSVSHTRKCGTTNQVMIGVAIRKLRALALVCFVKAAGRLISMMCHRNPGLFSLTSQDGMERSNIQGPATA